MDQKKLKSRNAITGNRMEEPLCCCEYINTKGERSHLLACFCDCEALDEIVDKKLRCEGISEELETCFWRSLQDRARVPGPRGRGAVLVGCDVLVPLVSVPCVILVMSIHWVVAVGVVCLLPVLLYLTFRVLIRKFPRSRFFHSLAVSSGLWLLFFYSCVAYQSSNISWGHYCIILVLSILGLFCMRKTTAQTPYLDQQLDTSSGNQRCPYCHLIIPDKVPVAHCSICGRCVVNRDHHCIWLHSCIGRSNRKWLVRLLINLLVATLIGFYCLVLDYYSSYNAEPTVLIRLNLTWSLMLLCGFALIPISMVLVWMGKRMLYH